MITETQTYLLYFFDGADPTPFYAGEAIDPYERFEQHKRDAVHEAKTAYEFLRSIGSPQIYLEVVPNKTEAQLIADLTSDGYTLYNDNKGRKSRVKTNNWASENDRILARLEATDDPAAYAAKSRELIRSLTPQRPMTDWHVQNLERGRAMAKINYGKAQLEAITSKSV